MCPQCEKPLTVNLNGDAAAPPTAGTAGAGPSKTRGAGIASGRKNASILSSINLDKFQSSTKIEALREELDR